MKAHQPCRRCGTTRHEAFREPRAKVCESCRPAYELERAGRTCYCCLEVKHPSAFPLVNPNTQRPRRFAYCASCVDKFCHRIAKGATPTQIGRELLICRSTVKLAYQFWHRWHPEAPALSNLKATRINSRGQMVRCCRGCSRKLVVKDENFYVSHAHLPVTSPQRWDYLCRRCRVVQASAYNKDKRLQGDENFYERRREAQRRWVERNPGKAEEARQRYRKRKKNGEVIPMRERTADPSHPRVERAPFLAWVEETLPLYPGVTEFASLIGIPARTLLRLRTDGGRWIELDTVDDALQREGGPTILKDLYPHLFEEQEAA